MDQLQTFNFNNNEVRTVLFNNVIYFVGKDIADVLQYTNPQKAIRDHVDDEDKMVNDLFTLGSGSAPVLINESGLYSLVLSSKLPQAKEFKKWITAVVLPSIRKNGGYIANQESMSDDELMARALEVARRTIANKDKKIEELTPKALFADCVSASNTSILVGELAKLISQNGVNIGQNRLFEWLRINGYLIKNGSSKNMPTQRSMDMGLMEIKERTINNNDGSIKIVKTPKVTGKGQVYFVNKLCVE